MKHPPPKQRTKRPLTGFALTFPLLFALFITSVGAATDAPSSIGQNQDRTNVWLNDASRLNSTPVLHLVESPTIPAIAEVRIRAALERARSEGLKVTIGGARHSMGGQTLYPKSLYLDMRPLAHMDLDPAAGILTVGAGATWDRIIPYLDARGFSVAVMQSNNSFSVGGSISVNCHGWQHNRPPIASTVESFRLIKADGEVVQCSRTENPELFSLVLGGYGLFGVILEVKLRIVPNERYRIRKHLVRLEEFPTLFEQVVDSEQSVGMAYTRLSIHPRKFLSEAILNVYESAPAKDGSIPALRDLRFEKVRRRIFRNSVGSDFGKRIRWNAEKRLEPLITSDFASRNQLLNQGVEVYENRSTDSTDILHEYFVPRDRLLEFVQALRASTKRWEMDLLNVTVRDLHPDGDSFLRYADQKMFALVLLFNQPMGVRAESNMQDFTRELIDAAIDLGGRYYLPYRLHATPDQFHRAYPMAKEFFEHKRRYDPDELFQSQFYWKYGREEAE